MPTLTFDGLCVAAVNSANDDGSGGVDLELDDSRNLAQGKPYYRAGDTIEITIEDGDVDADGEFNADGDGEITVTSIKVNGAEILSGNDKIKWSGSGSDTFEGDAYFFVEGEKLFFLSPRYAQDFSDSVKQGGKTTLNVNPREMDLDLNANGSIDSGTVEEGDGNFNIFAMEPGVITDASDFSDDGTVTGTSAGETIFGGINNNDPDTGTVDGDTIAAGAGDDTIYAGAQADIVDGEAGNDTLFGGTGDDTLTGGAGNDTFHLGEGADVVTGGTGADVYVLSAGGDTPEIDDFDISASGETVTQGAHSYDLAVDRLDISALTDVGNALTNQDGTVTADEVTVTDQSGNNPQIVTFPNGEQVLVPRNTIDTSSPEAQFASLVAMGVPPCFAPGTLILTVRGEVAVEDLRPGDRVVTADRGAQPLRWIGRREVVFDAANPRGAKDKPIEIKAGALGAGCPRRRLIVSPQHRMMLSGALVSRMFRADAVLALAKGLVGLDHVRVMCGKRDIVY